MAQCVSVSAPVSVSSGKETYFSLIDSFIVSGSPFAVLHFLEGFSRIISPEDADAIFQATLGLEGALPGDHEKYMEMLRDVVESRLSEAREKAVKLLSLEEPSEVSIMLAERSIALQNH